MALSFASCGRLASITRKQIYRELENRRRKSALRDRAFVLIVDFKLILFQTGLFSCPRRSWTFSPGYLLLLTLCDRQAPITWLTILCFGYRCLSIEFHQPTKWSSIIARLEKYFHGCLKILGCNGSLRSRGYNA
jgi:hypothetical protein